MRGSKRNNPPAPDSGPNAGEVRAHAAPETDLGALPHTEDGAIDLDAVFAQLEQLARERDDLRDRATRALADFQNYQRRAALNEQEARRQGLSAMVHSLLAPLDYLDLALQQDESAVSAAQLKQGVQAARDQLLHALASHGVEPIRPQPDDEFRPGRHEAMLEQPAEGVAPGHISQAFQTGYALGQRVLRPAKVAVAPAGARIADTQSADTKERGGAPGPAEES
jgi:molecular chaperone GrpE